MSESFPLSKVQAEDTVTELRCVVVKPILRYLEHLFGTATMMDVISSTQMNLAYLENGNHWISYPYYCRLLARLVEVTNDPKAPLYAARDFSNRKTYNTLEAFLTRLVTPVSTYRFLVQFNSLWNRYTSWQLLEISSKHCVIVVKFLKHEQDINNCLALQGSLSAVPPFFGLPRAEVTHRTCLCAHGDSCVYEITWLNKPEQQTAAIGGLICMAIGLMICIFIGWGPGSWVIIAALALAGYFMGRTSDYIKRLAEVYASNENQSQTLLETMLSMEVLNRNLQQQIEERTSELSNSNLALQQALKDLKESQRRTMEIERQAAIGALAAGTAHEMNSPLNGVRLSLQALKEECADNPIQLQIVENADRATYRCSRIVKELLSFSREPQQLTQLSLSDIIRDCIAIFKKENPNATSVIERIDVHLPVLHLDRAQIQQAVLNLFTNANDAMNGNGEITVSLTHKKELLVLTIADNGPGIASEILERIFDPFFSTKHHTGKGLGLGLSITYELITRNGGTIDVESTIGHGTCFTICFPLRQNRVLSTPER